MIDGLTVKDIIEALETLLKDGSIKPEGLLYTVCYETGEKGIITAIGNGDNKNVYIGFNNENS